MSKTLTLTEINLAITNAGRLGQVDDALEIFNSIEKFGIIYIIYIIINQLL